MVSLRNCQNHPQSKEIRASSSAAVLLQLRTDLDPQHGVAGASDFVALRMNKTGGALRGIDRITDEWAAKSEAAIARYLDRGTKPTVPVWRRIVRFLTEYS